MAVLSTKDKRELIDNINWDKEFDELDWNEKANFAKLHGFHFLNNDIKPLFLKKWEEDRRIIEHRGKEKLDLYI